ncbi:putative bli-3 protein [Phycomyces nitens]|nr:putative bli-3 protein [Phycomyces nitens]
MSATAHSDPVREVNKDLVTGTEKKIEDLHRLIEGIKVCMMTTRCSDTGRLFSRAMSPRMPDGRVPADLWFFTNNSSHKLDELVKDPNVNLGFYKPSTAEWISVSGTATLVNDREKIAELYAPDIKAWFGDLKDGINDGGPNDPRIGLIFVKAETVHYSLKDVSAPIQIWNIAKGMITGEPPKVSADRELNSSELQDARRFEAIDKPLT